MNCCTLQGPEWRSNAVTECFISSRTHLASSASGSLFSGLCSQLWRISTSHRRSLISSWETLWWVGWGCFGLFSFIRKSLQLSSTEYCFLFFFLRNNFAIFSEMRIPTIRVKDSSLRWMWSQWVNTGCGYALFACGSNQMLRSVFLFFYIFCSFMQVSPGKIKSDILFSDNFFPH